MMRKHRGSAILAALIVVGVLAVVTVATLTMANISKGNATRDARKLGQAACVDAARQYVLGRLRVFGLDPTTITLNQTIAVDSGNRQLRTGHINGPVLTSVEALPASLIGNSGARNRDMSNVIVPGSTLGGRAYRVVVACTDPLAGDLELEFTFKYGL
jgi:type II secretory pathway pseudopilin PulG